MQDGTVSRAFEIARLGTCKSISDVRRQLKQEGYSSIDEHFSGPTMKKQLNELLKAQQQGAIAKP
jgi:hypothetical protein